MGVVDKLVSLSAAMPVSVDLWRHGLCSPVELVRLRGIADEGDGRCLGPPVSLGHGASKQVLSLEVSVDVAGRSGEVAGG